MGSPGRGESKQRGGERQYSLLSSPSLVEPCNPARVTRVYTKAPSNLSDLPITHPFLPF